MQDVFSIITEGKISNRHVCEFCFEPQRANDLITVEMPEADYYVCVECINELE